MEIRCSVVNNNLFQCPNNGLFKYKNRENEGYIVLCIFCITKPCLNVISYGLRN